MCEYCFVVIMPFCFILFYIPGILMLVYCTQTHIHSEFGGIVPVLAMEGHRAALDEAVHSALVMAHSHPGLPGGRRQEQGKSVCGEPSLAELMSRVDAVSVTRGPGLELCLRIGCQTAQVGRILIPTAPLYIPAPQCNHLLCLCLE